MTTKKNTKLLCAYLIVGEDQLKRDRVIKKLRKRVEEHGSLDFNHDVFEIPKTSGTDVIIACNTLPFASDLRLVELSFEDNIRAADSEEIVTYLKDPCETSILAISCNKLAKNTRLYKAFGKLSKEAVIECPLLKNDKLVDNIRTSAVSYGFTLGDKAARKIIELIGNDTVHIDKELKKLSLVSNGLTALTEKDIESLIAHTNTPKPWDISNAIAERNLAKSIKLLRLSKDNPIAIMAMCLKQFREISHIKSARKHATIKEIASSLKKPDWQVEKTNRFAQNYSERELRDLFISARDCEKQLKSSSNTMEAFENWVISVVKRS